MNTPATVHCTRSPFIFTSSPRKPSPKQIRLDEVQCGKLAGGHEVTTRISAWRLD